MKKLLNLFFLLTVARHSNRATAQLWKLPRNGSIANRWGDGRMRNIVKQIEIHNQHGEISTLKLFNRITPPLTREIHGDRKLVQIFFECSGSKRSIKLYRLALTHQSST